MNFKIRTEALHSFIRQNKNILLIVVLGFLVRFVYTVFFTKFVAQSYFGQESFFAVSGDFAAWTDALKNLLNTGKYTVNPDNDYGYFGRMPGYSIFIAPFYLLFGENYFTYAISFTQVLLDTLNIYFIYRIYKNIFPDSGRPYLAPVLYAIHPINILWSSPLFSEELSVFLLMLSVYIYTSEYKYKYFTVGLISGFNILVRPQMALFCASFIVLLLLNSVYKRSKREFSFLCLFILGVSLSYGPWPARNYLIHDKVVLTQDISGFANWGIDVNSYTHYIVSVQNNWDPQFSQIIYNRPFEFDKKIAYAVPSDSADLAKAIYLSQHYGSGFSNWAGYWKTKVARNKYDTVITELFTKLQKNQMRYNAYHYWVTLPLSSLKKCLFKLDFTKPKSSFIFKMTPLIFGFRTLLILAGIAGSIVLFKNQELLFKLIFLFFVSWYVIICFGPSAQMRNIEMRYLLQADTLMLLPAAYLIDLLTRAKTASGITTLFLSKK